MYVLQEVYLERWYCKMVSYRPTYTNLIEKARRFSSLEEAVETMNMLALMYYKVTLPKEYPC